MSTIIGLVVVGAVVLVVAGIGWIVNDCIGDDYAFGFWENFMTGIYAIIMATVAVCAVAIVVMVAHGIGEAIL